MAAPDYSQIYQDAGNTFNVDPLLTQAVAQVESGGEKDPDRAVSRDAQGNPVAHGRMQLTGPNLSRLNVIDPYNPQYNIPAGTRVLDEALTASGGDVTQALRIYQGGQDQSKWGPINAAYPGKVAAAYQALKAKQPTAQPDHAAPDGTDIFLSGTGAGAAPDGVDAFLSGTAAPGTLSAPAATSAPTAGTVGDDTDAFLSGGAVATPKELAGAPGKPGQIDPLTGKPFQFAGNVPANDAVGQSTGQPIAENKIPGIGVQAAVSLPTDEEGRRRIAAHELFPDKPDAEARSRVFYGSDGRLAAVGENGKPFYIDPIPMHQPGLMDVNSPASIASTLRFDNPLARAASIAGELPAMVGGGVAGALTVGNPLAVGVGAGAGDLVRQTIRKYVDPTPPGIDMLHAGGTALTYGALEGAGRAVGAFLPKNALARTAAPATGPLSAAGRLADEPKYLPEDFKITMPGKNAPTAGNPLATPAGTIPANPTANALTAPPMAMDNPHLEGITPPKPGATPLSPEDVKELAAIPESLPTPRIPILTQSQAEAHADKVIRAMAGVGNRTTLPSPFEGAHGTLADITGNAGLATLQRGYAGAVDATPFDALKTMNNATRGNETASIVGHPEDITEAQAALDAKTGPMRNAAFANKKPADISPVVAKVDEILKSPAAQEDAVKDAMIKIRSKLVIGKDEAGNEIYQTDPEQLYGIRKAINTGISPAARGTTSDMQLAAKQAIQVRDALDPAIDDAAPGFSNYINAHAQDAASISGMKYLQGLNLTNNFGDQTLGQLDRAVKQIDKQRSLPGARPADSVSDEQYQRLTALRDDMRREARTQTAGKTNSGTFQDLATNSRVGAIAGNPLVGTALGGLGAIASGGGPLAAMAGTATSMVVGAQQKRATAMFNKALLDRLMNVNGKGEAALRPQ